ncbi:TPA: hypothetical protein VCC33_003545 [Kluyvera cryocrescens]|nr:hypothetical protein [Kluyvera cryocrescens]
MTINLTDPANHPANGQLPAPHIERVIEVLKRSIRYQNGGDMAYVIADAIKGLEELLVSRDAVPVAWRYRYVHTPKSEEHGSYFTTDWKLCDSEDECNPSDCFERQPLYTVPPAPKELN